MPRRKIVKKEETDDDVLKKLLTLSLLRIKDFIVANPGILYKGIPLGLALYISFPVLTTLWYYLPWIWATYNTYRWSSNFIPENIGVKTVIEKGIDLLKRSK